MAWVVQSQKDISKNEFVFNFMLHTYVCVLFLFSSSILPLRLYSANGHFSVLLCPCQLIRVAKQFGGLWTVQDEREHILTNKFHLVSPPELLQRQLEHL